MLGNHREGRRDPLCVCVLHWLVGMRGWKRNRSLIYCIIRSRFTRAHLHPTLISLPPRSATFHSIPSSPRETTATRITISGERVESREGHRGGDKKGLARGSWDSVVRMVLRYVTGNLVQFTITYYVTTTIRPTTNRTWLTDRENPTMITNVDTNVFVNVAIMFSFELRMDDKESRSKSRTSPRLYVTFIYIYPPWLFKLWPEAIPSQPNKNSSLLLFRSPRKLSV